MSSKFLLLLFCSHAAFAFAQAPRLRETWETGYVGSDATGKHVLGYWKFDEGSELKDSSGKGHDLSDHGAKLTKAGRFGGALESFAGFPVEDKSHGLHTDTKAGLSPKGAFTIEMWFSAKAEFAPEQRCFLLDKKYVSDDDYQWTLGEADKAGNRRMTMKLGFGAQSDAFYSEPLKLEAGVWHHVAFTYDAEGTGRFYFDGQSWGGTQHAGLKSISPGGKPLCLGDRIGSNYSGFPGFIDEVRLCDGVLEFGQVKMQILTERAVWRRMEPGAKVTVLCRNLKREPLQGARLIVGVPGVDERTIELPALEAGAEHRVEQAFNTALKAGEYPFRARLELTQPKPYTTDEAVDLQIVNRPLPNRMPVVMWGGVGDDFTELKGIGFTHCLGLNVDEDAIWKAHKPVLPEKSESIAAARRMLDKALAKDVGIVADVSPSRFLESKTELLRVDRAGKPYARKDICASLPLMAPFFENVGATFAQTYGSHPAFQAALVDTEVRDNSVPSFNAVDIANYRAFGGADIPKEVMGRSGVSWKTLPTFPEDRVIADDDPILKYFRWVSWAQSASDTR